MNRACINPNCDNQECVTTPATLSVKRFFGVKRSNVGFRVEVCANCLLLYEQHDDKNQTTDAAQVTEDSNNSSLPSNGESEDDVKIKEEEDDVCVVESDDELYYEIDDDFEDMITESLVKLNFENEVEKVLTDFRQRSTKLTQQSTHITQTFEHMHDRMQQMRSEMDEIQGIEREEVEPLDIVDTFYATPSLGFKIGSVPKPILSSYPGQGKFDNTLKPKTYGRITLPADCQEVIPMGRVTVKGPVLPPMEAIRRKEVQLNMRVYAMKASFFGIWYKARIVEIQHQPTGEKQYKVRFDPKRTAAHTRVLSGKHLAYIDPAEVILPVGTRIIALYKDEYWNQANSMYAGIIAEPPKIMNNYRYLVFFDDGYAQYISHNQIHLVCEVSKDVWDDIHPDSKEFIRSYLQQYPERPMVKLQKGQVVKTEWNGKWWIARVVEVDASLVKMYFDADKRTEWIYRGSTRLGPLYSELANAEANKTLGKIKRHNLLLPKKKNAPYVEYTRGLDDPQRNESDDVKELDDAEINAEETESPEKKQVAKKHTTVLPPRPNVAKKSTTLTPKKDTVTPPNHIAYRLAPRAENEGVYEIKFKQKLTSRQTFRAHKCNPSCLTPLDDPVRMKGNNPLLIPMLCGWERLITKYQTTGKRIILYRAPCGRRLRSLDEVHCYLTFTKSQLSIDLFCFDTVVHCYGEFVPTKAYCYIRDISYSKENVAVSCVNSLSRQYPEYVEYSTKRLPAKGVHLNLDPEYLCGCDCVDDCKDSSKCLCQQSTLKTMVDYQVFHGDRTGYVHRRLKEQIVTGIYECNVKCKCRKQCLNRVVQNGLQLRLQVFKTEKRGWGLRCLDDIPQGCFICIYAGQLLTEQGANEDGTQFGDEYLAELDYIEVVEKLKEGYESDVADMDGDEKRDEPKKVDSGSEEEELDRKEDKKGNKKDGDDDASSDSDFEVSVNEPLAPRQKSVRNKDRRGNDETGKTKSSDSNKIGIAGINKTSTGSRTYLKDIPPLSPETLESIDGSNLVRKPRIVDKRPSSEEGCSRSSNSDVESMAESKPSTSTSPSPSETVDSNKSAGDREVKLTAGKPTRFRPLPDPKRPEQMPVTAPGVAMEETSGRQRSVRTYFGEEYCYIMDAKAIGNIGRYLNHSCCPNVFVQNVFVDTHDLRFPWVAFFAAQYIRAGTELTWDYNYDVGSVPGKVLYCYCTAAECRGRLL